MATYQLTYRHRATSAKEKPEAFRSSPRDTIHCPPTVHREGYGTPDILSGTCDFQGLDDNVELLLQHLKIYEEMEKVQNAAIISDEEFTGKLKVWKECRKESTTTSPSGVHLSQYKALFARHEYSHIQDNDNNNETAEDQANLKELRDELNHMQQAI